MKTRMIDHVQLDSAEAARRVERLIPFVSDVRWPAHERWSLDYIKQRAQKRSVVIFRKEPAGGTTPIDVDLREYLDIVNRPEWGKTYELSGAIDTRIWVRGVADPGLGALLDDLPFPSFVDRSRLFSVNLLPIANGGYDNGNHYDPNGMHNLNVQIKGEKRWQLFHPDLAGSLGLTPALADLSPPLMSSGTRHPSECTAGSEVGEVLECTLRAGQVLFVPAFWMHWVRYGDDSKTMSANAWWAPESVPLTSITASWAFVNALIAVFRTRMPDARLSEICAAIAGLAPETRTLLLEIESTLIADRKAFEGGAALSLRNATTGLALGEGLGNADVRDRMP